MKTLHELIQLETSTYQELLELQHNATSRTTFLTLDNVVEAEDALLLYQAPTNSYFGTIIYKTGGVLINDGWLRILGGGSSKLSPIHVWNHRLTNRIDYQLIIAYDVLGGYFFIENKENDSASSVVFYFSPQNFTVSSVAVNYKTFIQYCFTEQLTEFYKNYYWATWQQDIQSLPTDHIFDFTPPLWTTEGKSIAYSLKTSIPIQTQLNYTIALSRGLEDILTKYQK